MGDGAIRAILTVDSDVSAVTVLASAFVGDVDALYVNHARAVTLKKLMVGGVILHGEQVSATSLHDSITDLLQEYTRYKSRSSGKRRSGSSAQLRGPDPRIGLTRTICTRNLITYNIVLH